jgi:beta-galactosidase
MIRNGETEACAHDQFYVNAYLPRAFEEKQVQITENSRYIYVSAGDNEYTLDKISGEIIDVKAQGESLGGVRLNVWRAPLDNDRHIRKEWERRFLHRARPNALAIDIKDNQVQVKVGVGYARSIYLIEATITYTFHGDGVEIATQYNTERKYGYEYYPYLPRIGWTIKLDKTFDDLRYLAYGKGETYADMYEYSVKAEYRANVQNEYYPYAKPQESGSHYLPEYAEVSNGETYVRAEGMRSFSAIGYSAETLTKAMHHDELPESDGTYFSVDYYMTGVGTGSCGPAVQPPYQMPEEGEGNIRLFFGKKR